MSNRRIPVVLAVCALLATLTWTACGGSSAPVCTPLAETCNGLDDDCDGQVDEGFEVGAACTAGVGACQVSGVMVCAASGASAACSAAPGDPTVETCNQQDDDCDGQVDQGLAGCCVPAATRACGVDVGACRAGLETCDGTGAWGACLLAGQPVILPGSLEESCDGLDQDCDGQSDEAGALGCTGFFADQDQDGVGAGTAACLCAAAAPFTAGEGTDCDDADAGVHPGAAEACNGRDDDCDTLVDDGFDVGAACSAGVGACAASGVLTCAAGGAGVECSAAAGGPGAEVCNGVDDDCDGATDEAGAAGCTMYYADQDGDGYGGGEGACLCAAAPPLTTPATGGLDCDDTSAAVHPGATEICNGRDDDCDGATDEGDPALGQACDGPDADLCAEGVVACASGQLQCTDATGGNLEACNGADDDCDGQTDEEVPEVGQACDGADGDLCLEGAISCQGAAGLVCGDVTPTSVELCNGLDDDCDGTTDEGLQVGEACLAGIGACAVPGSYVCRIDGTGVICDGTPLPPQPERCNGLDDDCDGATDEDDPSIGQACDGADADQCFEGVLVCAGGALQCTDATATSVELCNGLDDDCDAGTDEDFMPGTACSAGIGACLRPGVTVCSLDGTGTACGAVAGAPSPEICNAVDDDCDGTTDESPAIPACAKQAGVCAGALKTEDLCVAGAWLACTDATYAAHSASYQPAETACDSLDNDCDGATDEGFSVGTACSAGIGACLRPGVTVCRADGTGTACSAVAGTPGVELCNGIDDDCDGTTDENPVTPLCAKQAGVCAGALMTADLCVAGAWLACSDATYAAHSASYQPAETACADGLDNDCDGQRDAADPGCP